jgi:hypothetical protein
MERSWHCLDLKKENVKKLDTHMEELEKALESLQLSDEKSINLSHLVQKEFKEKKATFDRELLEKQLLQEDSLLERQRLHGLIGELRPDGISLCHSLKNLLLPYRQSLNDLLQIWPLDGERLLVLKTVIQFRHVIQLAEEARDILLYLSRENFARFDLHPGDGAVMFLVYMLQPLLQTLPENPSQLFLVEKSLREEFLLVNQVFVAQGLPDNLRFLLLERFVSVDNRKEQVLTLYTGDDLLRAQCLFCFQFLMEKDTLGQVWFSLRKEERQYFPYKEGTSHSWLMQLMKDCGSVSPSTVVGNLGAKQMVWVLENYHQALKLAIDLSFPK